MQYFWHLMLFHGQEGERGRGVIHMFPVIPPFFLNRGGLPLFMFIYIINYCTLLHRDSGLCKINLREWRSHPLPFFFSSGVGGICRRKVLTNTHVYSHRFIFIVIINNYYMSDTFIMNINAIYFSLHKATHI